MEFRILRNSKNKGLKSYSYHAAVLPLCFRKCMNQFISHDAAYSKIHACQCGQIFVCDKNEVISTLLSKELEVCGQCIHLGINRTRTCSSLLFIIFSISCYFPQNYVSSNHKLSS